MDFLQLEYFLALAESEHLNSTAEKMMVTPPAISSSLSRLEKELHVKLFDRVGRNIKLNENGEILKKYAEQIFLALNNAKAELNDVRNYENNSITVAITNPNLWNKPIKAFYKAHPEISVSLVAYDTGIDSFSAEMPELRKGQIDYFIASSEAKNGWARDMEYSYLFESKILLAVSPKHRFAGKKEIALKEASNEWFVNSPHNTSFRKYCDELCHMAGFVPKSRVSCDYILRPKMLVNEDMVCIATSLGKYSEFYEETVLIPIVDPPCSRIQAIYWNPARYQKEAAIIFKDFLIDYWKMHANEL